MSSVPEKRRGLGRGLEVLVGGLGDGPELAQLAVEEIHPNPRQPRRRFEPEAGSALAKSIEAQGLLQPVVVRPRPAGGYELIAGERRWRAAREAGVAKVPALVREADDQQSLLLSLVENVAREQLSPVEEARAYAILVDEFGLAVGEIGDRVGRSTPAVSNRLRLLELPDDVLWMIARGELTEGHAKAGAVGARTGRAPPAGEARGQRRAVRSRHRARGAGDGRADVQIAAPLGRPCLGRAGGAGNSAHHGVPPEGHRDARGDPVRGRERAGRAGRSARKGLAIIVHCGRLAQLVRAPL